jgi:3-phosphoglycerate kinase
VAVSKNEQLPQDGQIRPKHVAVGCDFNVILNEGETVNRAALKTVVKV